MVVGRSRVVAGRVASPSAPVEVVPGPVHLLPQAHALLEVALLVLDRTVVLVRAVQKIYERAKTSGALNVIVTGSN